MRPPSRLGEGTISSGPDYSYSGQTGAPRRCQSRWGRSRREHPRRASCWPRRWRWSHRSGQVTARYVTRPKSRTMRVTRQLMLPPSTVTVTVESLWHLKSTKLRSNSDGGALVLLRLVLLSREQPELLASFRRRRDDARRLLLKPLRQRHLLDATLSI
jgi:hypothetical protein